MTGAAHAELSDSGCFAAQCETNSGAIFGDDHEGFANSNHVPSILLMEASTRIKKKKRRTKSANYALMHRQDPSMQGLSIQEKKCRNAQFIISQYAFVDVKPILCDGSDLTFSARRGATFFQVRIDPRTGSLLEVRKQEKPLD